MTSPMEAIRERARSTRRRILLPEGDDPRIREGTAMARDLADVVVLSAEPIEGVETIDPGALDLEPHAEAYHALRRQRGVSEEQARDAVRDPLVLAALMVRAGEADGTLAGAAHTTADTVRAAIQMIGPRAADEAKALVSSFFLMLLDRPHHAETAGGRDVVVFADCGLVVAPSVQELAQIAVASADSFARFTGATPKVAMLSFSTMGSARHPRVDHVREATEAARALRPDLAIAGELQFDAAFLPGVAASKAPDAAVAGDANVFVFPDLEAGNIGYKIAERIGGAGALGPVLQGLARPANDLSRGCSAQDVADMIAVTAVQCEDQIPPSTPST